MFWIGIFSLGGRSEVRASYRQESRDFGYDATAGGGIRAGDSGAWAGPGLPHQADHTAEAG